MRVIAGKVRGVNLKTPDGQKTRPTIDRVKEAMFSIIHFDLPGSRVLDLFSGTGQLGIEALSRGAEHATFVDSEEKACALIRENLRITKLESQATVIRSDYLSFLSSTKEKYDIILLDPPYAEVFLENSIKKITEIDILHSGGIIVAERPADKALNAEIPGYNRSKDYKYGNVLLTLYRKDENGVE